MKGKRPWLIEEWARRCLSNGSYPLPVEEPRAGVLWACNCHTLSGYVLVYLAFQEDRLDSDPDEDVTMSQAAVPRPIAEEAESTEDLIVGLTELAADRLWQSLAKEGGKKK